ncbi:MULTISPECIES: ShlB/FhaC/HecB family hemolysin secretion/activation protein [Fischerella]|uniref:ShlB/FhaC/HecB family hemolysin secretion/activation protein n=1 Tax=Fischerella muscicola CCMEE 5323 TaxID=2019572 RepID=A0A2N6JYT8_FISMU|nr:MULTISPECIES: ShlB/FhaC/HecB family hemolysin secretion/activation protein [Fischerella]MBD2432614.1 ShlB/FhaC/HecB family hemolysin secretion/activation protein [Fischerella sp. FACHB-380]PLZ86193.1 ShlB/FhaC/HecB family hemolysin secretion/activation protein [Fischerella muscicola CCMEE 5323]
MSDKLRNSKIVKTWLRRLTVNIIDSSNHAIAKHKHKRIPYLHDDFIFSVNNITKFLAFLASWRFILYPYFIICAFCLLTSSAIAQTSPVPTDTKPNPNIDRFPQPLPTPQPLPPSEEQQPTVPTPPPTPTPEQPNITIPVSKIEVVGSTILTQDQIAAITKPFAGRSVTLKELQGVADNITQLYLNQGYLTSRAILGEQTITDGVVKILVIEGSLEKIEIEGTRRLNPSYVRNRVKLATGKPLRVDKIEDQLRLLKEDPLFTNVEATLKGGTNIGQSILTVRVKEANPISGVVGVDNYSPPAVGSERFGGAISYRNVTGLGDELIASYYRSITGGSNSFDFIYRVPVNAMNGTLQLRYSPTDSEITQPPFSALDITGDSQLYELSYRQPFIRTPREEFALSLGFALHNSRNIFVVQGIPRPLSIGPDNDGTSKTRVLKFGQDYIKRDLQGAWAVRSQFNFGLDVFDATSNSSSAPDGSFFSWLGQIQRVQRLGRDNLLIAQADVQLTPDALLPSQQFLIGGGQSLRGYRQNARAGDNGFRFSVEDRIAILRDQGGLPNLQLAPFVDMGAVWNVSENPNRLPDQTFLASAGLGLIWEPVPRLLMRFDYAVPFVDLSDRGNNAQDRGFNFSVNYNF